MPKTDFDRYLLAGLVRAVDWLDNSLQRIRAANGLEPVHRTQSLMLVHIASGVVRPTEIAREMGQTRQNVHQMAKPLIKAGLIEQAPDPEDRRSIIYRLTESSSEERAFALATFRHLDTVLAERIGADNLRNLKKALSADWGPEVDRIP